MSIWFNSALGHELWNPSNRAAEFYLREIRSVEAFIETESGIGDAHEDEVRVEPSALAVFFDAAQEQLQHPTMRAQVNGLLAITAVLLQRSDVEPRIAEGWEQLRRDIKFVDSRMPQ